MNKFVQIKHRTPKSRKKTYYPTNLIPWTKIERKERKITTARKIIIFRQEDPENHSP